MACVWYEKTVEYTFLAYLTSETGIFISPLDGSLEKAGDAILRANAKWVLIEFKRDSNWEGPEEDKFSDFPGACAALRNDDDHHYVLYGVESGERVLGIDAVNYFSKKSPPYSWEGFINSGKGIEEFNRYLKKLIGYRNNPPTDPGIHKYSMVFGLGIGNKVIHAIPLADFVEAFAYGEDLKMVLKESHK